MDPLGALLESPELTEELQGRSTLLERMLHSEGTLKITGLLLQFSCTAWAQEK